MQPSAEGGVLKLRYLVAEKTKVQLPMGIGGCTGGGGDGRIEPCQIAANFAPNSEEKELLVAFHISVRQQSDRKATKSNRRLIVMPKLQELSVEVEA